MSDWRGNDTYVVFVSLRIIRKENTGLYYAHARTRAYTHTHNFTRFPVLVVLEKNGLSKAAVCMQKFHVAIVKGKGKVFSTNAIKHGVTASPILNSGTVSASRLKRFNPRYNSIGSWVGPTAGMHTLEKIGHNRS